MASHIASLWNRGWRQLENGLLQVLHTSKLYLKHHFFKVDCLYDVLLYKIQHLLLTIHFSIAPMCTNSEFNFDCLQSAFSLTIGPVLISVRAIANDVAPSPAWVTSIVNWQWTHRLRYTFKHFFSKNTYFLPVVSFDGLQEILNFCSFFVTSFIYKSENKRIRLRAVSLFSWSVTALSL